MNLARGEDRSCSDLVIFWLGDPAPPSLRFGGSPCLSTLPNTFDIFVLLRVHVMSDCRMRRVRGVDERSDRSNGATLYVTNSNSVSDKLGIALW